MYLRQVGDVIVQGNNADHFGVVVGRSSTSQGK